MCAATGGRGSSAWGGGSDSRGRLPSKRRDWPLLGLLAPPDFRANDRLRWLARHGPYAAEVWPSALRATGMGSAYGFGGIGKMIGPADLVLVIGSSNTINPEVALDSDHPRLFLLCRLVRH